MDAEVQRWLLEMMPASDGLQMKENKLDYYTTPETQNYLAKKQTRTVALPLLDFHKPQGSY
ncbi:hypothetical protein AOLI_G00083970 [Acnodon oligacanthus]